MIIPCVQLGLSNHGIIIHLSTGLDYKSMATSYLVGCIATFYLVGFRFILWDVNTKETARYNIALMTSTSRVFSLTPLVP